MLVDLNADVGESPLELGQQPFSGELPSADDARLMPFLTSANIACGVHAGGPNAMRSTVALALAHGVAIGAHPSLAGGDFGRREVPVAPADAADLISRQLGALATIAAAQGARVQHVKPHGALYNMAARDRALADAVAGAVASADPSLILFGLAGSALVAAGRQAGLRTASEVFADRAYQADGSLVPRTQPGAVIDDPEQVAARALAMVRDRAVIAVGGSRVALDVDTICVHGDTPGAARLAALIRRSLEDAGVLVRALSAY